MSSELASENVKHQKSRNQFSEKRLISVVGDIAYVPLTRGYKAIIDSFNVPLVSSRSWSARICDGRVYASTSSWKRGSQTLLSMHRLIFGESEGYYIDHLDGNCLNNRRSNLRISTNSQNQFNSKIRIDNSSGYKGVSFHKPTGKWQARIRVLGKQKHLGLFESALEAGVAREKASLQYHREFARSK